MDAVVAEISIDVETFASDLTTFDHIRIASKRIQRVTELVGRQKRVGAKTLYSMTARMTCQIIVDGVCLLDTNEQRESLKKQGFGDGFFTFRGITSHKGHTNLVHALENSAI